MLQFEGKEISTTLAEIAAPSRAALLIWDLENAIAPNAFNYQELLPNLKKLAAAARAAGVPVFYSVQTNYSVHEEAAPWIRVRMKRGNVSDPRELAAKEKDDPHGREIVEGLKPEAGDTVFQKRRPDAFIGTDLDLMLRSRGVRTIVVGGVATEGGVEGTARTGRNLGYDMVVLKDGSGSRNRENHDLAIKLMERMFLELATCEEVAAIWGGAK